MHLQTHLSCSALDAGPYMHNAPPLGHYIPLTLLLMHATLAI